MDTIKTAALMIELDCLLDTRISLLASYGDDILSKALEDGYHERLIDTFRDADNFNVDYANRTKELLKDAILTPLSSMLTEFAEKTLKLNINTPFHSNPKIIVNCYPYTLTKDEEHNVITAVVGITNEAADVELVYMTPTDITPSYVKQLRVIVMYDYPTWLEIHSDNRLLTKQTCPEVTLISPAIYYKPFIKADIKAFRNMEEIVAPFIRLTLVDISNFCFIFKNP